MRRIPLRWALPIFNLAMDALLIAVFVVRLRYALSEIASYPNVRIGIDPRVPGLQEPFLLLTTANLPAGIMTLLGISTMGHDIAVPYDSSAFLWPALYELLALPFWFFVSRVPSAYWWCIASMIVRMVAFSVSFSSFWKAGPALQAIFWLIVAICTISAGLWRLTKRVRTRLRRAA
jgi:hypothetical protein